MRHPRRAVGPDGHRHGDGPAELRPSQSGAHIWRDTNARLRQGPSAMEVRYGDSRAAYGRDSLQGAEVPYPRPSRLPHDVAGR